MKLIMCENCRDIFNLSFNMKKCSCGKVFGRYVNNRDAEISEDSLSIAIGNGSLRMAIQSLRENSDFSRVDREEAQVLGKIHYAWVRGNSGISNPHTKTIKTME